MGLDSIIMQDWERRTEAFKRNVSATADILADAMREELGQAGGHSAPGSPPHRQTGELQASFSVSKVSEDETVVGSTAPYWAALEFGTSRMAARPFVRPALDQTEQQRTDQAFRED